MPVMSLQDILISERNTGIPYFPSSSWNLTEESKGDITLPTFNWIQAFYDTDAFTQPAQLVVWSGAFHADKTPIVSKVRFAFSGERINFKGKVIYASGVDRFGNTITSTVIGSDNATDLLEVIAYGAMY